MLCVRMELTFRQSSPTVCGVEAFAPGMSGKGKGNNKFAKLVWVWDEDRYVRKRGDEICVL